MRKESRGNFLGTEVIFTKDQIAIPNINLIKTVKFMVVINKYLGASKILLVIVIILMISNSCTTLSPLGSSCVMINDGISGEKIVLSSYKMRSIDSVFVSDENYKIEGFKLYVKSRNGDAVFYSNNNKISPEMKVKIWDDPKITHLIFSDFIITGNSRILRNSYFKNKEINITINFCPICP